MAGFPTACSLYGPPKTKAVPVHIHKDQNKFKLAQCAPTHRAEDSVLLCYYQQSARVCNKVRISADEYCPSLILAFNTLHKVLD